MRKYSPNVSKSHRVLDFVFPKEASAPDLQVCRPYLVPSVAIRGLGNCDRPAGRRSAGRHAETALRGGRAASRLRNSPCRSRRRAAPNLPYASAPAQGLRLQIPGIRHGSVSEGTCAPAQPQARSKAWGTAAPPRGVRLQPVVGAPGRPPSKPRLRPCLDKSRTTAARVPRGCPR